MTKELHRLYRELETLLQTPSINKLKIETLKQKIIQLEKEC